MGLQKIADLGQLFMTGVGGHELSAEERQFIREENIGGILLFSKNFQSPAQLAELINHIQELRSERPLLIAVDQEGGRVQRFKAPFTVIPPMHTIGLTKSPKICFELHQHMAKQLKAVGVNLNLGPCCDIWTNEQNKVIGDRSFGHSPEVVEKFVSAAIRGLQTEGIISCAKHFPGHGDTLKDSHISLPLIKNSREVLMERELIPFRRAIKSKVPMVMMGHLLVDCIDEEWPISLSEKAHRFLRDEFKFKGVIITDDMQMGALTEKNDLEQMVYRSMIAGADILEFRDFEQTVKAYEACQELIKTAKIKRQVIEEKIKRVKDLKDEWISQYKPSYIPDISKSFSKNDGQRLLDLIDKMNVGV